MPALRVFSIVVGAVLGAAVAIAAFAVLIVLAAVAGIFALALLVVRRSRGDSGGTLKSLFAPAA